MKLRITAILLLAGLLLPAILPAEEIIDDYKMRVFWREKKDGAMYENRPYFDWLRSAPKKNSYFWGKLPFDEMEPLGTIQLIDQCRDGTISFMDPTFQRWGFQVPQGSETIGDAGEVLYFLAGSAGGGPMTCGYGGDMGLSDIDGDADGERRPGGAGDSCECNGRAIQVGSCAVDWVEVETDHNGVRHKLEIGDPDAAPPILGHRCPDGYPRVILMNLSTMW